MTRKTPKRCQKGNLKSQDVWNCLMFLIKRAKRQGYKNTEVTKVRGIHSELGYRTVAIEERKERKWA